MSRQALESANLQLALARLGDTLGQKNRDAYAAYPGSSAMRELARGTLERVLLQGERGYVIMSSSGTEAVLTVLAKQNAKLGLLFLDIKRAAEALSKLI